MELLNRIKDGDIERVSILIKPNRVGYFLRRVKDIFKLCFANDNVSKLSMNYDGGTMMLIIEFTNEKIADLVLGKLMSLNSIGEE